MDFAATITWFEAILDAEHRLTKAVAEGAEPGETAPAVEAEIRSHFLAEGAAEGEFTAFEFRLDPPETMMFKSKVLRRLARRTLFKAERRANTPFGAVARFFVSQNKTTGTDRHELAVDVAHVGDAFKVVALYEVCIACCGTGQQIGASCTNDSGGVVCAGGVKFRHGLRLHSPDVLESKRLAPMTSQEIAQATKSATPAQVVPLLDSPELTRSAVVYAAKHGNIPLLEAVLPKADEAVLHLALKASARMGQVQAVQLLLGAGAPANGQDNKGEILDGVCQHADPDNAEACAEVVKLLLAAGADANLSRSNGKTCLLHVAFAGWSADAARYLLDAGADLHAADPRGRCALDLAWEEFQERDKSAVRELFDKAFADSN